MSYVELFYHIVLRTKGSKRTLPLEHSSKLYAYIWGIVKNKKGILLRINGIEDHLHMFVSLPPTIALSDFIKDIKTQTNSWMKANPEFRLFEAWSEGYAALSCSKKSKDAIVDYIKNQREHHAKYSFFDEYRDFIKEMDMVLDDNHLEK